jgi:hypothetical protein
MAVRADLQAECQDMLQIQQSLPLLSLLLTCLRANFQGGRSNTICLSKGGTVVGHARPEYGPKPDRGVTAGTGVEPSLARKASPVRSARKSARRATWNHADQRRTRHSKAQDRWVPEHPAAAGKLTSNLPASPPHLPGVNAAPSAELQSLASGGEPKLSEGTHARRLSAGA